LILLDLLAEEDLRRSLEHGLRTPHGIVVDVVDDVLSRLLKCLVSGKASGKDVVSELRRILSDAKSPSIAPRGYVQRGQGGAAMVSRGLRNKHKVRKSRGGTYPLSHLYRYFGLVRLTARGRHQTWAKV
jgi:hypothetical protein